MSFKVVVGRKIHFPNFLKIEKLDKETYNKSYHLSITKGIFWVLKNYDGYITIENEKKEIIAYASLVSLKYEYYNLLKEGQIKDIDLPTKSLNKLNKKGIHYIYFSSVIIKKEYQSPSLLILLYNEILKLVINFANKGVYFASVLVDAISKQGIKFSKILNLDFIKSTNRNTSIFEAKLLPLKTILKGSLGRKIDELYNIKYNELENLKEKNN